MDSFNLDVFGGFGNQTIDRLGGVQPKNADGEGDQRLAGWWCQLSVAGWCMGWKL